MSLFNRRLGRRPTDPEARFWSKVNKNDPTAPIWNGTRCWMWTGTVGPYGRFALPPKRQVSAHKYAWLIAKGPVPLGLCVLHHCDNPPCVNPEHLFLGTNQDNAIDRELKGRGISWATMSQEERDKRLVPMVQSAKRRHEDRLRRLGPPKTCACGCGTLLEPGRTWVSHHNLGLTRKARWSGRVYSAPEAVNSVTQ